MLKFVYGNGSWLTDIEALTYMHHKFVAIGSNPTSYWLQWDPRKLHFNPWSSIDQALLELDFHFTKCFSNESAYCR